MPDPYQPRDLPRTLEPKPALARQPADAGDGKRPLRILFLNNDYWPSIGGVQVLTRNLAGALRDRGHAVAIVANRSSPDQAPIAEVDGLLVRRFRFNEALATQDSAVMEPLRAKLEAFRQGFQPDVVHINFPGASAYFHLQSIGPGQTTVALFHCALWPRIAPLARRIVESAEAVVVPSPFLADNLAAALSIARETFRVIDNGVDEGPLLAVRPLPEPPPARFLFAGRHVPLKGVDVAVAAIGMLDRRGVAAELAIAGSGELARTLSLSRHTPRLSERTILLGDLSQQQMAERFSDATALVVPSLSFESFSLVSAEAAFAGRPVLASRRGALAETVVDGETGLLFEPNDPASLAAVMHRVLVEPGLAARLGAAGRARAVSRYRLLPMVDRYERLYGDLTTGSVTREERR